MNQIKSKQIILHYSLHKTGSTYLQQNLKSKHDTLLNNIISYPGPTTFKKQLYLPWKYLKWEKNKIILSQRLKYPTIKALSQQADDSPVKIHTNFIFFKSIVGTLQVKFVQKNQQKNCNHENNAELYCYSQKEMKHLMSGLEHTFRTEDINCTIGLANRQQGHFIGSRNIQPKKEGQDPTRLSLEAFSNIYYFLHIKTIRLFKTLSQLKEKYNIKIIPFSHENKSIQSGSTIYLDNFIQRKETKQNIVILTNKSNSKNLHEMIRPSNSERSLNPANKARPIFTKQKWKLVTKLQDKNFVKSN